MRKGWIVETLQWIAKISSDFKDQSIEKSESSPYSLLESNLCVGEPDLWPVWSQSSFSSYLWTKFSLSPVYMVREMSSYTAVHWWGYNKGIVEKGGIVGRLAVRFLARTTYSAYMARTWVMRIKEFMTKLDGKHDICNFLYASPSYRQKVSRQILLRVCISSE